MKILLMMLLMMAGYVEAAPLKPLHRPDPIRCVPHCFSRNFDGSCSRYDEDFCGPGASCSVRCASRDFTGDCRRYDDDFCGRYASCTPQCESRDFSGQCTRYGADACASYP